MSPLSGPETKFKHTKVYDNFTADGYYFSYYEISGNEHAGTHLDAPRHFYEGKWTTDQIPLEQDDVILLVFFD